ncbi:hypothetical protein AZH53_07840 [Methanomicrobiaceae archaeon CYW5]|uniref:helix-turn-helix transcriptional regulator n=1 Tax=Methanovulcanius yangii TaxID=1789227 RepID=UPI0029CA4F88|nr:hypothetical protein [Methanovulcanius yangii]MBT8508314.1 hypothetical protein [Methanovulcanius yangii]
MNDDARLTSCLSTTLTIFRSDLAIRIFLALLPHPSSLQALSASTESSPSSITRTSHDLTCLGLVDRSHGTYGLSRTGEQFTTLYISLMETVERANPGAEDKTGKSLVHRHIMTWEVIGHILRSPILISALLAMSDHGMSRTDLRDLTGSRTASLTPRMQWLRQHHLVNEWKGEYHLTTAGNEVASRLRTLIRFTRVAVDHHEFWRHHTLDGIPAFAMENLGDLWESRIISGRHDDPYTIHTHFFQAVADAEYICAVCDYVLPRIAQAIPHHVRPGIPIEVVISPRAAARMVREPDLQYLGHLENYDTIRFFVADIPPSLGISLTDTTMTLKLSHTGTDIFDTSRSLVSEAADAHRWAMRLFRFFRDGAVPLEEFLAGRNR